MRSLNLLYIGKDTLVPKKDIIMILDYNEALKNDDTNKFLNKLNSSAHSFYIEEYGIKSIIISKFLDKYFIYYSPISSATLLKRSKA
jgi:hypothetical protein